MTQCQSAQPTREERLRLLNTVYIISKGRPQCKTAQTLEKMEYPGEWFIVCGNNDETLPEYQDAWGEHVLVFDWYDEVTRTDTLDNFGFDEMASGACPVRNATARISRERGELRHWQFDDDYTQFKHVNPELTKNVNFKSGREFESWLLALAEFGHRAGLKNIGFPPGSEAYPNRGKTFGSRVFNAHNMPSTEELFEPWVSRMNDDTINAINVYRHGGREMSLRCMNMLMPPTQSEKGGLSDIYKLEGTVRKSAYPVLVAPVAAQLVVRFGRYHHKVNWGKLVPKVLNEKYEKR